MNLTKIKQLVKQNGDTFIFIENGEPELVMMSFHEYEKLIHGKDGSFALQSPRMAGNSQREVKSESVLEETEFVPPALMGKPSNVSPMRLEDIRIEDLPL